MKSKMLLAIAAAIIVVAVAGLAIFLIQNQPLPSPTPTIYDIANGNITVNPGSYQYYKFNLSNSANVYPTVQGTFNVSNGETIRVYLMTSANFTAWQNHAATEEYYDSGIVNNGNVTVNLPAKGDYVLVYDNSFSATPKTVNTEVSTAQV